MTVTELISYLRTQHVLSSTEVYDWPCVDNECEHPDGECPLTTIMACESCYTDDDPEAPIVDGPCAVLQLIAYVEAPTSWPWSAGTLEILGGIVDGAVERMITVRQSIELAREDLASATLAAPTPAPTPAQVEAAARSLHASISDATWESRPEWVRQSLLLDARAALVAAARVLER